jgi:hypothetical protein
MIKKAAPERGPYLLAKPPERPTLSSCPGGLATDTNLYSACNQAKLDQTQILDKRLTALSSQ